MLLGRMMRSGSGRDGIWSVTDQGIVSLGNFCTGVVLARTLTPYEFGVFGLLYWLLLLLNNVHFSLVSYPLSVLSAGRKGTGSTPPTIGALRLTLVASVPFGIIVAIGALFFRQPALALPASFALLCWQVQETARRVLLSRFQFGLTIAGDVVSYLGQALAVVVWSRHSGQSVTSAFLIIGATSLAAAAFQIPAAIRNQHSLPLLKQFADFWKMGQPALYSNLLNAAAVLILPWLLAVRSPAVSGQFYALVALLGFTNLFAFGLGNFLIPYIAARNRTDPENRAEVAGLKMIALGSGPLVVYFFVLWIWPSFFLALMYGSNSPYLNFTSELRLLLIGYSASFLSHVVGCILLGLAMPEKVLRAQIAAAVVMLLPGLPLTWFGQLRGASIAFVVMQTVRLLAIWILLKTRTVERRISNVETMPEGAANGSA
jgi:O-antigen/teichoic acid export membrane protein